MKCPFCKTDNDRVIDSRAIHEGFTIRRRRECLSCKERFTTYERIEEPAIRVVKKDGTPEPFRREKIKHGLATACSKRPVSDEQIESVVNAIEREITDRDVAEIQSRELGELVMAHLRHLDQVAYVRFASVYRDFADAQDFVHEIDEMRRPTQQPLIDLT